MKSTNPLANRLLLVFAFLATLFAIAPSARAADTSNADVAAGMAKAAQAFLASLDAKQASVATMKFDDPARLDWHNIPKPMRKGLQVRDMTQDQRKLCLDLIHAGLSDT